MVRGGRGAAWSGEEGRYKLDMALQHGSVGGGGGPNYCTSL